MHPVSHPHGDTADRPIRCFYENLFALVKTNYFQLMQVEWMVLVVDGDGANFMSIIYPSSPGSA